MKRYVKAIIRRMNAIAFSYLPMTFSTFVRRREGSIYLMTNASAIKKKIPTRCKKVIPNRFIIDEFNWEVTQVASEKNLHPTIKDMFILNKHYTETNQYNRMVEAVDAYQCGEIDNPADAGGYWCKSHEDVEQYFKILINCYYSIKNSGYKTQRQLYQETGKIGVGSKVRNLNDEIELLINDAGELVFAGTRANHRFSIAKILGVKKLPVVLGGIDKKYLEENIKNSKKSIRDSIGEIVSNHNDLEYFTLDDKF